MPQSPAAMLRARLSEPALLAAPGAYDGLTARLVEQAGFPAVYMTGAGTAAACGYPDYGLVTMTEMVENARRMARAIDGPLIADADTGYGNELNVIRTVREFEAAGVSAIHLEDQEFPKRCGHLDEKRVDPREDFVARIRAAASARRNPDFLLIARTDARASLGLEEAMHRANAALEAGADVAFVEAPQSLEEVKAVPSRVNGPCLLNIVEGGKTPAVELAWAQAAGYRIAILPGLLLREVVGACDAALESLKRTGEPPAPSGAFTPAAFFARVGAAEWSRYRTAFRDPAPGE